MKRKDTVTRTVQILDILPGDPPQILTGERLRRDGKPGRLFQQMVPVRDADLFASGGIGASWTYLQVAVEGTCSLVR